LGFGLRPLPNLRYCSEYDLYGGQRHSQVFVGKASGERRPQA